MDKLQHISVAQETDTISVAAGQEELAEAVAHNTNLDGDALQTIGFHVGQEEYALSIDQVREIIISPRITRVPQAEAFIKGVINLHGTVIPVIDIAERFAIGTTNWNGGRVVVVEVDGEHFGLLAEQVSKVKRVAKTLLEPPPPLVAGIAAEFLRGVACIDERFLIFLDLQRILEKQ